MHTQTFDAVLGDREIEHVRLVKIDVEGHEFQVLEGMEKSLTDGKIDYVVFEHAANYLGATRGEEVKLAIGELLAGVGYTMRVWNGHELALNDEFISSNAHDYLFARPGL